MCLTPLVLREIYGHSVNGYGEVQHVSDGADVVARDVGSPISKVCRPFSSGPSFPHTRLDNALRALTIARLSAKRRSRSATISA